MAKMNWDRVNLENKIKNSTSNITPSKKTFKKKKNKRKKMDKIEMIAKYQGTCTRCWFKVLVGDPIEYFPETKKVRHQICQKRKRNYLKQAQKYID